MPLYYCAGFMYLTFGAERYRLVTHSVILKMWSVDYY